MYLDGALQWRHEPLATQIVLYAHESRLRGASVRCCVAGFGDGGTLRQERPFAPVRHLPVEIVLVDDLVVLQDFSSRLDRMGVRMLATLEPVDVAPTETGRED
ncbi:DUF190 domain-containing protein [Streptomyces sp. NPDC005202]|uniref:DUF190 domain-containing protein n=1 Tax=Streptomyces sp. NPDC005202 TaxID=3157021 RepID=UPI0033AC18BE